MDADETTNKPIEIKVGINLVVTGKYKQGVTGKKTGNNKILSFNN